MSSKRKIVPFLGSIVCRKLNKKENIVENGGIFLSQDNVDLYEVLDFSFSNDDGKNRLDLKKGDIVLSRSTGDEIEVNSDETVYLFKQEHIMCKVLTEEKYDVC